MVVMQSNAFNIDVKAENNMKNKIVFKELHYDKNENYKYIDEQAKYIDSAIRQIVYDVLNNCVNLEEIELLFVNNCKDPAAYKFFTYKDIEKIYQKVLAKFPSAISVYGIERIQLAILFYVNRFIYQIFEHFNIRNRRLKKKIILYYAYNHVFKVLKEIKGFLINQVGHLITFISPNISQIYELLYKYTDIDEDQLILTCINRYICNVSYKYNPFKISNLKAFVKLIFKQIISLLLRVNIEKDDEYGETSVKYVVATSSDEFSSTTLINKYEFLIDILKTLIYDDFLKLNLNKQIIFDTINENYQHFSTSINPFRLLYFISKHSYNGLNYSLNKSVYDDLMETFYIVSNPEIKNELKNEYPTLYKIIRSFTINVPPKNNKLKISFPNQIFKQYMLTRLKSKYWGTISESVIEKFVSDLSSMTGALFKNNIFIDSLTLIPITKLDENELVKDITKFYLKFLGA